MNDSNPHDETQDLGGNKFQPGDAAPVEQPKQIGRYRIERVLGKGGFGLVYLAYDEQLDRLVAIKVPHAKLISKPADAEAYLTEARTVANLDHPGIVPVYDVGSTEEVPCYIVSKYIEGTDLAARLKQSRIAFGTAAKLVAAVAEALHYAHKQGLVDRDVKPGNILLDQNDQPFVVDFGLALHEVDVGKGPRYAGTPAYMSPEQARGEGHRVDGRSDIYSLGAVFYELLTGRRTVVVEASTELLEKIISGEVKPPRQIDDRIPKELERICLKALAKRASDRYTTALDFAEDLTHFLRIQPQSMDVAPDSTQPVPQVDSTRVSAGSGTTKEDSGSRPIRIVPKGLRSFDSHDADFFLDLLPGPRDREGLPDSIRFWKTQIEELDPDNTFSIGLIYGPSGCGKSSLVKAGLLPWLSEDVTPVYIEATSQETETRLLHGLRKRCPALDGGAGLKDTLAALRRGQGIPVGKKVLIVIDQFEQWLHANHDLAGSQLVRALRQCSGDRVQCLLLVRDDFWLAISCFMQELEIPVEDGHNSRVVDLFSVRHARRVLTAIGRAFGDLPSDGSELNETNEKFVKLAIAGLAENEKVVCVRLALFAEMMKDRAWTPKELTKLGGASGLGVAFLEETFNTRTSPPDHRYHQKAARAVLQSLLPESGAELKGHRRSQAELLKTSGYESRPRAFQALLRILDGETRLITPTDLVDPDDVGGAPSEPAKDERAYQLTHDYLVPQLRAWLSSTKRVTSTWMFLRLFAASVLLGVVCPIVGIALCALLLPNVRFVHLPIRATFLGIGGFSAVAIATVLVADYLRHGTSPHYLWVGSGLISTGVFEIFSAAVVPGNAMVFLGAVASMSGGLLFSCVWLPTRISRMPLLRMVPALVLGMAAVLGIAAILSSGMLPRMVVEGQFTLLARTISVSGGFGFLFAALFFTVRFFSVVDWQAWFFAILCQILGVASFLFELSSLWDAEWWWWHLLRLLAYASVFLYVATHIQRTVPAISADIDYVRV